MSYQHPKHVRDTAAWLYVRHKLTLQEISKRLEVGWPLVQRWIEARGLSRSPQASQELSWAQRHPAYRDKQTIAFAMSEQGYTQVEIAGELNVSQSTVSNYIRQVKRDRELRRQSEMEHNIDSGYRGRSLSQRKDRFPVAVRDDVLNRLPEQERYVLEARSNGLYQHEIAEELGVSEARVCQIERAAMEHYRRLAAA